MATEAIKVGQDGLSRARNVCADRTPLRLDESLTFAGHRHFMEKANGPENCVSMATLPILDCCTGTGDLALMLSNKVKGRVEVVGTDFCAPMLHLAKKKHEATEDGFPVRFLEADTQSLPFSDASFQAVTVAFGLRNVQNTDVGLRELTRVCAPGGQVAVLEFSQPTVPGLKHVYQAYFKNVLPRVGQRLAKNQGLRPSAYEYLPNSVLEFPCGKALADRMEAAGLRNTRILPLTFWRRNAVRR